MLLHGRRGTKSGSCLISIFLTFVARRATELGPASKRLSSVKVQDVEEKREGTYSKVYLVTTTSRSCTFVLVVLNGNRFTIFRKLR